MVTTAFMVKSFGVASIAKFCAVIGLVWGLLAGLMIAIGIGGMGSIMGFPGLGIGAGIIGFVFMIIIGSVGGFISGAIMAIIYNIILSAIGGIEIGLEMNA